LAKFHLFTKIRLKAVETGIVQKYSAKNIGKRAADTNATSIHYNTSWLEESDPAGVILYMMDGLYRLHFPYITCCPDRSCPAAS
jgi:hypothetical protein